MNSQSLINWAVGPNLEKEMKVFSNSKLTTRQKADRKDMIDSLPEGSSMALSNSGITFLVVPSGSVDRVYTSVTSPDEAKIRRKVGEYHALMRWDAGLDGFVLPAGCCNAQDLADMF